METDFDVPTATILKEEKKRKSVAMGQKAEQEIDLLIHFQEKVVPNYLSSSIQARIQVPKKKNAVNFSPVEW